MAHTAANQAKLDAAQHQIDVTKPVYDNIAAGYTNYVAGIVSGGCYGAPVSVEDARSGYDVSGTKGACTNAGSCTHSDKKACENNVDYLVANYVGPLQAAWSNYNNALNNYNTVLAQVNKDEAAQNAIDTAAAAGSGAAAAAAAGKITTEKWLFFGLVALIIIGAAVFIIFKMPAIKKKFVIGGALASLLAAYLIFFGFKKPA